MSVSEEMNFERLLQVPEWDEPTQRQLETLQERRTEESPPY